MDYDYRYYDNRYKKKRRKVWLLPALLLLIAVIAFGAWQLGYVDRWLYERSLDQAAEATIQRDTSSNAALSSEEMALSEEVVRGYAYSQLSEEDCKKYNLVLTALVTRESQPYPSEDMDDLHRIYQYVQADHPELFYVNGVTMETVTNTGSGLVENVSIRGRFAYSEEETNAIEGQIEEAVARCFEGIPADADDYGKSKYLYEWLASNVVYDSSTVTAYGVDENADTHSRAQTVEGALLDGRAVCGGYASAYQLLMQRLGLQCTMVTGTGNGGSHAWCLVLLDGAYYYVDPTWADPQSVNRGQELGYINYDYLNVTTENLLRTHTLDDGLALPECFEQADNYYLREGLLFDYADEDRFGELAAEAISAGVPLQVRCADEGVYLQLRDGLVTSGVLGSYLPVNSYRYSCSDENLSILII